MDNEETAKNAKMPDDERWHSTGPATPWWNLPVAHPVEIQGDQIILEK